MAKTVKCPAGQWTRLIDNYASGMPASWTIEFRTEGPELSGKVRQWRSFLPLGLAMTAGGEQKLLPRMDFQRFWTNASYRLEVYPDHEATATFC